MSKQLISRVLGALAMLLTMATAANALPRGRATAYIGGIPAGIVGHTGLAIPVRSGAIPMPGGGPFIDSTACEYRLIWENSSGRNSRLCFVHELATSLYPNCSLNSNQRLSTVVVAGASQILRQCEGSDYNDVPHIIDMLLAGESPANAGLGLRGVVLMSGLFLDSFEA